MVLSAIWVIPYYSFYQRQEWDGKIWCIGNTIKSHRSAPLSVTFKCMTGDSINLIFLFLYFFLGEGMGESDCVSVPFQIICKIACEFFPSSFSTQESYEKTTDSFQDQLTIAFAIISIYYGVKDNKKLISPQLFTIFFYTNIIYIIKI